MKKYLLSVLFLSGAIVFNSSCGMNVLRGKGAQGTINPNVSSFNAVDINLPLKADITVKEGSQPGIQIKGFENVIAHIKTKIENNTLRIYSDLDEMWSIDCDGIGVQITMPAIKAVSLSGAPDAEIHGNITGKEFKLDISGAGKVGIDNINVENFSSEVSGAGSIDVKGGAVKNATYEVSGAGKINAFPLQTTETSASISGAGKGEFNASQKLSASVSGAGIIKY